WARYSRSLMRKTREECAMEIRKADNPGCRAFVSFLHVPLPYDVPRAMNPRHALLQVPTGAGVNSTTVRGQHILYSQRRVARVTSQREHTLKRNGLRKEKVTCQKSRPTRSPSTTTNREQESLSS